MCRRRNTQKSARTTKVSTGMLAHDTFLETRRNSRDGSVPCKARSYRILLSDAVAFTLFCIIFCKLSHSEIKQIWCSFLCLGFSLVTILYVWRKKSAPESLILAMDDNQSWNTIRVPPAAHQENRPASRFGCPSTEDVTILYTQQLNGIQLECMVITWS